MTRTADASRRPFRAWLAAAALILGAGEAARAAPHVAPDAPAAREAQVREVLGLVARGDLERAAPLARALARRFPDFALARLLEAELEAVEALDAGALAAGVPWSRALVDLLAEARARLALDPGAAGGKPGPGGTDAVGDDAAPRALVALGEGVDHVVMVDLGANELLLFARGADGHPRLIERHYAASGSGGYGKRVEGDLRTPLGVYRITGFRPDARLPALYGSGALTLDYPNALDRELGRTGSGIWLHGVPPDRGSRAPRSSEGCVTMSNDRLDALVARLDRARTLVVLADRVDWTTRAAALGRRALHLAAAGLGAGADATLVEVPGTGPGPARLAVVDPARPGDPGGLPATRFVALEPALQAALDVSP